MNIQEIAPKIKLLLMDCDGVLTDGRLYFSAAGEAMKVFHVRDGQGIALWHRAGGISGIISGRGSELLKARSAELGMKYLYAPSDDKLRDLETILTDAGLSPDEVCFIGDDVGDLEIMQRVGFSVAVADAADEVREAASYMTELKGGCGAVREVIDLLLNYRSYEERT